MTSLYYDAPADFDISSSSWIDILRSPANYSEVTFASDRWTIRGTSASGYGDWQISLLGMFTRSATQKIPNGTVYGFEISDPTHTAIFHGSIDNRTQTLSSILTDRDLLFNRAGTVVTITVSTGSDSYFGGAADDIVFVTEGTHAIDGGQGTNQVSFRNTTAPITVDLARTDMQNIGPASVMLHNISGVEGSSGSDFIRGTDMADTLSGGGGSDRIFGGGGDDDIRVSGDRSSNMQNVGSNIVYGGDGNDTITTDHIDIGPLPYSGFQDQIYGDAGNDTLIVQGSGISGLFAGNTGNTLYGGTGDDTLIDGAGGNRLVGGDGNDIFRLSGTQLSGSSIEGDAGYDIASVQYTGSPVNGPGLVGNAEFISVYLNQTAPEGPNVVSVQGVERLNVSGFVRAYGSLGNDLIVGEGNRDLLFNGGSGDDIILGGGGIDTLESDLALGKDTLAVRHTTQGMVLTTIVGNTTYASIEIFTFLDGKITNDAANILIDDLFYAVNNKDVWNARIDPDDHYRAFGSHEGRDPNALFSTRGYLGANADVKADDINPLVHYATNGWKDGRDPSTLFDTTLYLLHNTDVAQAGIDPLLHYLVNGMREGRAVYQAIGSTILANGFDTEYYLLGNPDVSEAGVDPFQHYAQFGWKEGRNPNAWFDEKKFLDTYPEFTASGLTPLDYYDQIGWKRGMDPSAQFDTDAYLDSYQDVANAGINPLVHYLRYGAYEMRETFGDSVLG